MTKKKNNLKIYLPIIGIILITTTLLIITCKNCENKNETEETTDNYQPSKVIRNEKYEPLDEALTPEQNLIKDYINNNLSELSPEKEVLGGKFYLTNIEFLKDKQATIKYEDGHTALTADIKYELGYKQNLAITEFNIIKE